MKPQPERRYAGFAAAIVAAIFSVSCEENRRSAGWWQGEQERIELSHQLELKQYRFDQTYTRDFEEYEKLRHSTESNATLLKSLRKDRLALTDEIKSMENQWAEFRESTIREQRQRAMGSTFDKLSVASGRTFENVSVSEINDAGVTIRHTDGSARLRYADLDASQRLFFGLEADLALAAVEKEAQDAARYEGWIESRMAQIEEKKEMSSLLARQEESTERQERAALARQQLAASNARPLAQPASSVGSRSWRYSSNYSNYRTYRPTYRYVYYNTPTVYSRYGYRSPCYPAAVVPQRRVPVPYQGNRNITPRRPSFAETTLPSIP